MDYTYREENLIRQTVALTRKIMSTRTLDSPFVCSITPNPHGVRIECTTYEEIFGALCVLVFMVLIFRFLSTLVDCICKGCRKD